MHSLIKLCRDLVNDKALQESLRRTIEMFKETTKYKVFKDLEFKPHPLASQSKTFEEATQARLDFDNGYGVSVITGRAISSTRKTELGRPYEVAILYKGNLDHSMVSDEVVKGWLRKVDVSRIMIEVQKRKKVE